MFSRRKKSRPLKSSWNALYHCYVTGIGFLQKKKMSLCTLPIRDNVYKLINWQSDSRHVSWQKSLIPMHPLPHLLPPFLPLTLFNPSHYKVLWSGQWCWTEITNLPTEKVVFYQVPSLDSTGVTWEWHSCGPGPAQATWNRVCHWHPPCLPA